jgi:hypothetical protein
MDDQSARTPVCAHCGASLSGGRFCTNCGARIGTVPSASSWSSPTDTAERRYDVLEQPPAPTAPTAPLVPSVPERPLFRDEPVSQPTVQRSVPPILPPPPPEATAPVPGSAGPAHASYHRQGPGAGLWIGAAIVMLAVLLLGGFLLLHGSSGDNTATDSTAPLVPKTKPTQAPHSTPTAASSAPSTTTTPTAAGPATNVAGLASVSAPTHAPGGVDFAGQPVTYVAPNVVDGINDTCWRQVGDGTGTTLTFRLDRPTRLTRVGLINGYAKIAYDKGRRFDWYLGNRRVLGVDWIFDDGSRVSQDLGTSRTMQQRAIKPVTTTVVRLQITAVSPPGKGRAARDDTSISEVVLIGHPT